MIWRAEVREDPVGFYNRQLTPLGSPEFAQLDITPSRE